MVYIACWCESDGSVGELGGLREKKYIFISVRELPWLM